MRVSLSLPEGLLRQFDGVVRAQGYPSRSEAAREALEDFLLKHRHLGRLTGDISCVVTFSYPHGKRLEGQITELQHRFGKVVTSTSHVHRGEKCLEVVFLQGRAEEIREFVGRLSALKRVGHVAFALGEGA
jgi:CopG family nickel-responsive transcriptional regulator